MSKKTIIMAAAGLVLLGAGGGAAYYFTQVKPAEAAVEPEKPIGIYEMEQFLVNISSGSGDRFARLTVKLALAPDTAVDEIKEDPLLTARLRDKVLTLLTAKSFSELNNPEGKEAFRAEIAARIAPLLKEAEVKEVLFGDFVVQ
jgi:flagellar FliL protein